MVLEESAKGPNPESCYNQRYPTFARVIGANFAYVRLQNKIAAIYESSSKDPALTLVRSFPNLWSLSGPASVNIAFRMRRWRR